MSRKTEAKTTTPAVTCATTRTAGLGRPMKGAEIVVECLECEGVEVIFGYAGGASLELH